MNQIPRREFLKNTATVLAAGVFFPPTLASLARPVRHLGVQLYSVRNDMAKDPIGTLEAIAQMGFNEVEAYGYSEGKMFGMSVLEFSKVLKSNGLTMPSSHCNFTLSDYEESQKDISDRAKKAIEAAVEMGQDYIIFPWLKPEERPQVLSIVRLVNAAATYAQKAGIRFGYHNHDFEFISRGPDGRLLMEWLLHEIDPKMLTFEMDLYWVCHAQYNPLDWFRLYPGRWELCHCKDLANTPTRETIEVGDGVIDFPAIFKQSAQAGLKHYVIELEHYRTTPLEGIQRARQGFLDLRW